MISEPVRKPYIAEQEKTVERFGRTNPPPNEQEALTTIDGLNADVASIEAKLDHADPGTFPNDGDYQVWRRRATAALAHTKQELTFLEKWVQGRQQTARKNKRQGGGAQGIYDDLQVVAQRIRGRVHELAEEIGSPYTPRYSATVQPATLAVAQERMGYLTGIKQQLQGAFSEVTAAWTEHPLRRDDMPGVKAPLQKILSKVEVEIGVVRSYVRTYSTRNPSSDWKGVCVGALTRAIAEGFKLQPEEQMVFDQIRSYTEQS
jgi:hypothetical protein